MAHRKWKEIKLQPSMLPGPAVPGSCLASFHFRWAIRPVVWELLLLPSNDQTAPNLPSSKGARGTSVFVSFLRGQVLFCKGSVVRVRPCFWLRFRRVIFVSSPPPPPPKVELRFLVGKSKCHLWGRFCSLFSLSLSLSWLIVYFYLQRSHAGQRMSLTRLE